MAPLPTSLQKFWRNFRYSLPFLPSKKYGPISSLQKYPPKLVYRSSDLRMRLLHSVRIFGGSSYDDRCCHYCGKYIREQNVFGKMIFFTYIKEPSTISQSASFIINMQLLCQSILFCRDRNELISKLCILMPD